MSIFGIKASATKSKPNAPTIGTATDVGTSRAYNNGSATVTFTAPAFNGKLPITSYTVTSSPGGYTATGASSPLTVTGLQSSTSYTFTTTATNSVGTSNASSASGSITATTVPQNPTIGTATCATGQSYTGSANVSIPFTAGATGGKSITSYTVTSSSGNTGTGASSPITISDVVGTARTYTVTATNANGTSTSSSASNSVTPSSVPQAPTIGTVTVTNSTTVSIPFTAGATGGSAITSYTITSSPSISLSYSGTSSPFTVTGSFAAAQAYTFTITATNANGTSTSSSASNSVTPLNIVYGAYQFHGADATNFSNGAWNGAGARKFTFSGETFAAITGSPTYRVRSGGYSNTSVAGYAAGGCARTSAMGYGTAPYASYIQQGTPPTTDMRSLSSVEKLTYSSDSWSTLSSTITLSSNTGQTIDTTGMSNSGTAGYTFNSTASGYSSGNFISANTAVSKMSYSNDTFSSLGTIASTPNAPFQSIYSSGLSQNTQTNYRTAISNSGTAGYVWNGASGAGGSINQFYKWAYSTDTYSGTAILWSNGVYAATWTSGFSNGSTAGYFFDTASAGSQTIFKYNFSTDTVSSVSTLSTNRGRGTSTSNGTTAGYIFGGNLPPVTSTDKLTFSTDTRSTIAATVTAWDASTTISSNSV